MSFFIQFFRKCCLSSPHTDHLHISACGTDTIIIVPTAELENANTYAIGSEVAFTFSGASAHLFDRETGLNLEA